MSDIIGKHEAVEKVCPFSLNEREPRTCVTSACMAWVDWKLDKKAGVCSLIPLVWFDGDGNRKKTGA